MVKQSIPQLRFPVFEKEDYSSIKFGSVIKDSGYGPRFNGNDYDKFGNVKTIRGTDISLEGEILYDQVPIAKLDESFIKNHILKDGDLVMITTADCGLTGVFREQEIKYIPSAYAVKISLRDKANPIYFKYFFQTTIAQNQINRFVRKATVANLPGSDIPKLSINIPLLKEQQKIASFLTDVDAKITQLTKKKSLLEQYKKGIMQKIFNQELRFKNDSDKEFPEWEEKKLGTLVKKAQSGGTPKSTNKSYYDGNIPFLSISDMTTQGKYLKYASKSISQLGIDNSSSWIVPINSLIYSMYASVGFVSINKIDLATSQAVMNIILKDNINIEYIYYYLVDFKQHIHRMIETGTQGNINASIVKGIKIKLPCLEEQTKIANFLSDIDAKIEALTTKIENTQTFKKGLLQQMFV